MNENEKLLFNSFVMILRMNENKNYCSIQLSWYLKIKIIIQFICHDIKNEHIDGGKNFQNGD